MADPDCPKIRVGEKLRAAEGKEKITNTPLVEKSNKTELSRR
jgi:hypothetical protein